MEEKDIREILKIILSIIHSRRFIWRVEGSANLKIQKIDVAVNDLDITTNDNGLVIFKEALKQYVVKDFYNEKIRGYSLICIINGFEVEINSYSDRSLNMFDKTKIINWKDLRIPILPLDYAKKFYQKINRKEKVELIEKHLKH